MNNVLALVLTVLGVAMVVAPIIYYTACKIIEYRLKVYCNFVSQVIEVYKNGKEKSNNK